MKNVHGEAKYSCRYCDYKTPDPSTKKKHEKLMHTDRENRLECGICSKTFPKNNFKIHLKFDHYQKEMFKCEEADCSFITSRPTYLKGHMKGFHAKLSIFKCSFCNFSTTAKGYLKNHETQHKEKSISCRYCSNMFSRKDYAKNHERTHTGEKPFPCDACEASFSRNELLTVHKRIHTGELPYKCDKCDKKLISKGALYKHKISKTLCRIETQN